VLLDEPSEGVSPIMGDVLARRIKRIKKQGISILLSEQKFYFAQANSGRAYVIKKGTLASRERSIEFQPMMVSVGCI
jgi:branched-chain amino acid transport system ATP-binding protein